VLKPLLVVLGAFAVLGVLMIGGWALTSATPDAPRRDAPAAASGATQGTRSTGGRSRQRLERAPAVAPRQPDATRAAAAPVRDLRARRAPAAARPSAAAGTASPWRSARPLPLRAEGDEAAEERARADAVRRLADLRRAERRRQDEIARRADAEERAEEAERAAEQAQDEEPGGE
jgi:hypothetical protein